jgi:hypothetical protein
MFEKAQLKLREAQFFLNHLRKESLPSEQVGFYWSAMLNSGKIVKHSLRATVGSEKAFKEVFESWHEPLSSEDTDLFSVLQAARDVEVHEKGHAAQIASKTVERKKVIELPTDPTLLAVYANYLARGQLQHEVIVRVTTYDFIVNRAGKRSARREQALFERVSARGPIDVQRYGTLLESLVAAFVSAFEMPSTTAPGPAVSRSL